MKSTILSPKFTFSKPSKNPGINPPLFPYLLSLLPAGFFQKYSFAIALLIDFLRFVVLLTSAWLLGLQTFYGYVMVAAMYITSPILATYNMQLNPRGLGALFMDALLLSLVLLRQSDSMFMYGVVLFLGSLILLTHKMTTQVMLFVLLCYALYFSDLKLLLLIPAWIFLSLLLSGGFYKNVLKAHWDIFRFWSVEWPLLGADPLKESPLYGVMGYKSSTRQFELGLKNFMKRGVSLLLGNYAPCVMGMVVVQFLALRQAPFQTEISIWVEAVLLFSILTVMVPFLRGLGFGGLYLYNGVFPAALLSGLLFLRSSSNVDIAILVVLACNIGALWRAALYLKKQRNDMSLPETVLTKIKSCDAGVWLSYPMQYMEHLAYLANKPVLWGGHGYGFKTLRKIFPVLRTPIEELINQYNLRFVLITESYISDFERTFISSKTLFHADGFMILELLRKRS